MSPSVPAPDTDAHLTLKQFVEHAVATHQSSLIGFAFTLLQDLDLARDVVQDTFIRLCQQDPAAVQDHLKSWLFTVCRNRALDHLRKHKRTQPLEESHTRSLPTVSLQPDENLRQQERITQLMHHLHRLSENQRHVIILKFQQGLSYAEIQEITGLTSTNIGVLIHTGLKRLREILPPDLRA